jgi:hypothetical protein
MIHYLITNLIAKTKTIPNEEKKVNGDTYYKNQLYGPRSFRHIFIFNAFEQGTPLSQISHLIGIQHASSFKYVRDAFHNNLKVE